MTNKPVIMKFRNMLKAILILGGCLFFQSTTFAQQDNDFDIWLKALRTEAVSKGFSETSINLAFSEIHAPLPRIVQNDRNQAEVVQTYAAYLTARVSEWKKTNGTARMLEHKALLDEITASYGVQARFIVAIWGMETNFGTYPMPESVFSALATLAYDKRRAEFYRGQFFYALSMLDSGFPSYEQMKGSWAGAMGQTQFMPENYERYAVDFDKDGKRDIWDSNADVLASIANYFTTFGWSGDETWGRRVKLPTTDEKTLSADVTTGLAPDRRCVPYKSMGVWRNLQDWQALGLRNIDGSDLPARAMPAALITADANDGEGYLVYRNFCTLMRYNPAFKYALSIALLSDEIALD